MKYLMTEELRQLADRMRLLASNLPSIRTDEDFNLAVHDLRTIEAILGIYKQAAREKLVLLAATGQDVHEATATSSKGDLS